MLRTPITEVQSGGFLLFKIVKLVSGVEREGTYALERKICVVQNESRVFSLCLEKSLRNLNVCAESEFCQCVGVCYCIDGLKGNKLELKDTKFE